MASSHPPSCTVLGQEERGPWRCSGVARLAQGQAQPGAPGEQEPAGEARAVVQAPPGWLQEGAAPACMVTRVAEGPASCQQAALACPAGFTLLGIGQAGDKRCSQQSAAHVPPRDAWTSCLRLKLHSEATPGQGHVTAARPPGAHCRSGCQVRRGSCGQQDKGS